jgi:hypothetical protein
MAGCSSVPANTEAEPPPATEAPPTQTAEPAPAPEWTMPWTSVKGYTYSLTLGAELSPLVSDISSAPPGFTNITVPVTAKLTVTNTTPSRKAPADPSLFSLALVLPGTSPLCELRSAWGLDIDVDEPGGLPDQTSYCGFYSQPANNTVVMMESEMEPGETRTFDFSGSLTGELSEAAVAQATADVVAPVLALAVHISYTPDDLFRCSSGFNRTLFWSDQAIAGCADVLVGSQ